MNEVEHNLVTVMHLIKRFMGVGIEGMFKQIKARAVLTEDRFGFQLPQDSSHLFVTTV